MRDKIELQKITQWLVDHKFEIYATKGSHLFLSENGIASTQVNWPDVAEYSNALDLIREKKIDLVINIPKNLSSEELSNDYTIRRAAVDFNIPLISNARLASAFIYSIDRYNLEDLKIKAWDEY
jgi:carbamoyl-phosphate synthase large subunit